MTYARAYFAIFIVLSEECHIFQTLLTATFLATSLIVLWTYILYPFALRFLSRVYGKPVCKGDYLPKITVIIPTYNEEEAIERKIVNTLELQYSGCVEIIVVDSNSSDKTPQIAKMFDYVKVIEERKRLGKTHAMNRALEEATGDVIIMTDAHCFCLSRDLLVKIAQNFFDQNVGAVAIPMPVKSSTWKTDNAYWKREQKLLLYESILDSVPTGHGNCFAFRRELVERLHPKCLADDVDISIQVRMKGYRIVNEPEVLVYEPAPQKSGDFYTRKVRRILNVLTTLFFHKSILFNPKYGWYGTLILPTRKLFPILAPAFLFLGFLSLLFLNFYFALTLLIAFLVLAFISLSVKSFLLGQLLTVVAWIKYICKAYKPTWDKIPLETTDSMPD